MSHNDDARNEHGADAEVRRRTIETLLSEVEALAQIGGWDNDVKAGKVTWSPGLYGILGLDPATTRPCFESFLDLVEPEYRDEVRRQTMAAVETKTLFEDESPIRRPDGEMRWVRRCGRVIRDETGAITRIVGAAQDTTDRQRFEEQLRLSGKMAAVGTLAVGVAHQVNNPLVYIIGGAETISEEITELIVWAERDFPSAVQRLAEIRSAAAEIRQGAERIRDVVRDLRMFAKGNDDQVGPVSVRGVLEATLNLTWNEIRHHAQLVRHIVDLPLIEGNASQLGQVFLNLILNAAHAIPEGRAEENEIKVATRLDPAGQMVVEVSDTGAGIPDGARARLFDPFFTTKPVGSAIGGLGLSASFGIISRMGGRIEVESAVGKGSVFRVFLPVPASRGVAGATVSEDPHRVAGGKDRVLVVDDDALVATAVSRLLEDAYSVEGVTKGRDALEKVARGERFDVILCDVMMPEVNGIDLFDELDRVAPDQARRIVFMSGGTFGESAEQRLGALTNLCIEKPFRGDDLRAIVRAAILKGHAGRDWSRR